MANLYGPVNLIKKSVAIYSDKDNFSYFVKIYLVLMPFVIISIVQTFFLKGMDFSKNPLISTSFSIVGVLYFLVSLLVWAAGIEAIKRVLSKEKLSVKSAFASASKKFFPLLFISIILFFIVAGGFVLLIIPGIIFLIWFFFSRYLVVDQGLKIGKALGKSRQMIKGKFWYVLWNLIVFGVFTIGVGIVLSFIPYGIGSVINEIFGVLFILPSFLLYKELL